MRNLRLFAVLSVTSCFGFAGLLAACSDDDTPAVVNVPDGGGTDGTTVKPDTGGGGEDAGSDVKTDTSPPFDAGLKTATFANEVANALCNALTKCCFGQSNVPEGGAVDGGTFDRPECLQVYLDLGFEGSLIGNPELTQTGKVELDQAKGAECLQKINAMTCNLAGTEFRAIRSSCFAAVKGTVPAGQACKGAIECAPGNYCEPGADAGLPDGSAGTAIMRIPGTCKALKTTGGDCSLIESGQGNFIDSLLAEYACSYRANGETNLRCDSFDPVQGDYRPRTDWKCAAQVANDADCNTSAWCASGICDVEANFKCKSPTQYFAGDTCTSHVNP